MIRSKQVQQAGVKGAVPGCIQRLIELTEGILVQIDNPCFVRFDKTPWCEQKVVAMIHQASAERQAIQNQPQQNCQQRADNAPEPVP
jgi:hypothetical protein